MYSVQLFAFLLIGSVKCAQPNHFQLSASISLQNVAPAKLHNLSEALAASEKTVVTLKDSLNLPSLTFGFSVRGKSIFQKAWGLLDLENSVPANTKSIYRLASISKTFTSAVVGRLVDQGLVRYSDPLSLYLKPDVYPPKTWSGKTVNITLGQLLSHTAGEKVTTLSDIEQFIPGINCTQMLHQLAQQPLIFEPGTNFTYSNYGFQLIGAVIEAVTKKSYQQVLREFFTKHNLTSSHVEVAELMLSNRARYYMAPLNGSAPRANVPAPLYDELINQEGYWGSGGLLSNIGDLLRYGQLIIDAYKGRSGAILSKSTLTEMWTSRTNHLRTPFPPGSNYGYGWVTTDLDVKLHPSIKHRHFNWHNGGLGGVSTVLIIYPEEEVVGVALTNKGNAQGLLETMIITMMENVYEFV